ncbi:uncharacterized protein LOC116666012 isoform X4 [Camelus ferus]|uniref:Uncharacterized protein LOC116666012 isoform X4 n=1 Tax=Camelus ferus TaxID=419612 RepID=A0A8B8TNW5_CAMFR|nr:uncharacterized protein LOC116666012 isoform X4 [Camelus ferus]
MPVPTQSKPSDPAFKPSHTLTLNSNLCYTDYASGPWLFLIPLPQNSSPKADQLSGPLPLTCQICPQWSCLMVNCRVLIHMSMGFMMLALVLCLVLLPTMSLSFRPVFRRLNKADLVFSSLSLSIGFLIVLSLTLFVVNCETLQPRPQVSYLMTTYLCWSGGALMLWAGALSYLNHVGMWGRGMTSMERRLSYRRWVSQQSTQRSTARTAAVRPRLQVHRGRAPVHFPPQDPPLSLSKQWHPSFSGH